MSVAALSPWHLLTTRNQSNVDDSINQRERTFKPTRPPMFLLNNLPTEEIMAYEKYCQAETFETTHFLSSLTSFQMNQELNEKTANMNNNVPPTTMIGNPSHSHVCNDCGKSFLYKHHLMSHEKMHLHQEMKPHQNDSKLLNIDSSEPTNIKIRPHVCNKCGKSFVLKHHLTSHEKTHTGLRPHACEFCGKTFTHKHCLNTHLLLHSSQRPYECVECKKRFTLKHHLISHARVHNRDKPFICEDCGLAFALKRHLVTHSKFHAGKRPFVCDECGESFTQKDQLVMHSRFHGSLNSYVCSDCGETFTRKFELVAHGRIHGKLPHVCHVCSKEFLQKRTLLAHLREHSKDTCTLHVNLHSDPTLTEMCTTSSISTQFYASNLGQLHTPSAIQNGETKESLMCCQECGALFSSHEALILHRKLHSGDMSLVTDIYTLASDIQQRNFPVNASNRSLPPARPNNKRKREYGAAAAAAKLKKFVCVHCSKGFSEKRNLQQHENRHPGGTCILKPYGCATCGKAFHQKNHLVLHERLHMNLHGVQNGRCANKVPMPPLSNDEKRFREIESGHVVKEGDRSGKNQSVIVDTN